MQGRAIPPLHPLQPHLPDGASVKVFGLGGVGGILSRYLAIFLAGSGRDCRLVLVDGDTYEPSNASRMFFRSFGNKAAVTREELLPYFTHANLTLLAVEDYVSENNCRRLIQTGDTICLTVDNHATRKLVSDHCATLDDICLISGGNDGIEPTAAGASRRGTYGNVQVFVRRGGRDCAPALDRFHPEIAQPADRHPEQANCVELATSVPQVLFTNLMVASAMLNTLWLYWCDALHYPELAFDIAEGRMRPVPLPLSVKR